METRLDTMERHAVESVRRATRIQIIIDTENQPSYLELKFDSRLHDISDLRRNLRLAVQDYFQKAHRGGKYMIINTIYLGDCLDTLRAFPDCCIDCCVTSPPYYALRDYGEDNQIGLEDTPEQYIKRLSDVFDEVRRVLKPSGTLWLNIGDSYAGSMKGAAKFPDNAMNYKQGTNRGLLGKASVVKKLGGDYKPKDLIGIPWMLAFALRSRGWFLRQDIIWHKPNPMPESVRDRCTKAHEYIFLLSKSRHYYFDSEAIAEPVADATVKRLAQDIDAQKGAVWPGYEAQLKAKAPRYGGNKYTATPDKFYRTKSGNAYQPRAKRNKRDVWTVSTKACKEAHFATFPPDLIQPCILAGCPEGGTVLDPFIGSGTTGMVARILNRNYVGIELNQEYKELAERRILQCENLFNQETLYD